MKTLYEKLPDGSYTALSRHEVREAALEAFALYPGVAIKNPEDTTKYLQTHYAGKEAEIFSVVYLNNRHRVIACIDMFHGTIDGTSVYPREIAKTALEHNAAAVILAHNHPSGVAEPSQADERITQRVRAGLELLDIRLLDHLIFGDRCYTSLAARGMI